MMSLNSTFNKITDFIRSQYPNQDFIHLHSPVFLGNEKKYLAECIDSTFVSSVGNFVTRFEDMLQNYTGAAHVSAVVNGTNGLHACLHLLGVTFGDEVITQPLTFIATCNAISYTGAKPIFVDVDTDTLGMSPESLKIFFSEFSEMKSDSCINKITGKRIAACVPMHTFGHPLRIKEVVDICNIYNVPVVEDAAESLGSFLYKKHTGLFGVLGVTSFNGNKIVTTGGGGAILTKDFSLGNKIKHLTTTAKVPHEWEFIHDMVGFNYRMPNINAALGCAQLEFLPEILESKRSLAFSYADFFSDFDEVSFFSEREDSLSNYWLNSILLNNSSERDAFLQFTNNHGVMTRPAWTLMNELPMYKDCFTVNLDNSRNIAERLVNIPSGMSL